MQVVTQYPDGLFNWVDLMTTDIEGAKTFYSALFGWETVDTPIDMGQMPPDMQAQDASSAETSYGFYSMFKLDGKNVAGGGQMPPDMQAQGIPSAWTSYVKHDNADAVAEKISAAGGSVIMPPMDVMEEGRMLNATDPTGAVFGVWQPKNHIGAELVNIPNTLTWNELHTRDVAAAKAFYSQVFGWQSESDDTGYVTWLNGGRRQAGMMEMDENWDPNIPANWSVYFVVEDVDSAAAKVQALGGNIIMPPMAAGEVGKFAVVQDPQGATFSIIQLAGPGDPPPGF